MNAVTSYVTSSNIQVFPCVNRASTVTGYYQQAMVSEYSMSSIVNKFIDTHGFIINKETDDLTTTGLQFNIYGYYFDIAGDEINTITTTFKDCDEIWAYIELQELDTEHKFNDLIGTDNGTYFTGLHLIDSENNIPRIAEASETQVQEGVLPNGTFVPKPLLLMVKDTDGKFVINAGSRKKFDLSSYGYQILDGGEITED